jgi:hypothetical protein
MATFNIINSYTATSAFNTITFNNIPNTYTDLCIYISSRSILSSPYDIDTFVQANSQSTNNYPGRFAYYANGGASSTLNTQSTSPTAIYSSATLFNPANQFSNNWSYIANYNSTTRVSRVYTGSNASTSNGIQIFGQAYPSANEAITSLTFKQNNGSNFDVGTSIYLYGIKNS